MSDCRWFPVLHLNILQWDSTKLENKIDFKFQTFSIHKYSGQKQQSFQLSNFRIDWMSTQLFHRKFRIKMTIGLAFSITQDLDSTAAESNGTWQTSSTLAALAKQQPWSTTLRNVDLQSNPFHRLATLKLESITSQNSSSQLLSKNSQLYQSSWLYSIKVDALERVAVHVNTFLTSRAFSRRIESSTYFHDSWSCMKVCTQSSIWRSVNIRGSRIYGTFIHLLLLCLQQGWRLKDKSLVQNYLHACRNMPTAYCEPPLLICFTVPGGTFSLYHSIAHVVICS